MTVASQVGDIRGLDGFGCGRQRRAMDGSIASMLNHGRTKLGGQWAAFLEDDGQR